MFSKQYFLNKFILVVLFTTLLSFFASNPALYAFSMIKNQAEGLSNTSRIKIKNINIQPVLRGYRSSDLTWLYKQYGKNLNMYQSQLSIKSFSLTQYQMLIKQAYQQPSTEQETFRKRAAITALEHSLYRHLYEFPTNLKYKPYRPIIYNSQFLRQVFPVSKTLIRNIPENLEHYPEIITLSLNLNPNSFEYFPLREKLKLTTLDTLFYFYNDYEHPYQKMAIPYADKSLTRKYLSYNGQLLQHVSPTYQDNPRMVYTALLQNEDAFKFVSSRLKSALEEHGLDKIRSFSTWLFLFNLENQPKLDKLIHKITAPSKYLIETSLWKAKALKSMIMRQNFTLPAPTKMERKTEEPKAGKHKTSFAKVSHDAELISAIENKKKRTLVDLWLLKSLPNGSGVYLAYFQPIGRRYLGSIVYHTPEKLLFSDYPAIYSSNGNSIWRVDDNGEFGPEQFQVREVISSSSGQSKGVEIILEWKGSLSNNMYRLIERDGKLIKGFINYEQIPGYL